MNTRSFRFSISFEKPRLLTGFAIQERVFYGFCAQSRFVFFLPVLLRSFQIDDLSSYQSLTGGPVISKIHHEFLTQSPSAKCPLFLYLLEFNLSCEQLQSQTCHGKLCCAISRHSCFLTVDRSRNQADDDSHVGGPPLYCFLKTQVPK